MLKYFAPIYVGGINHVKASEWLYQKAGGMVGLRHEKSFPISSISWMSCDEKDMVAIIKDAVSVFGVSVCCIVDHEEVAFDDEQQDDIPKYYVGGIMATPTRFKYICESGITASQFEDGDIDGFRPIDSSILAEAAEVKQVSFSHTAHRFPIFIREDGSSIFLKDFS